MDPGQKRTGVAACLAEGCWGALTAEGGALGLLTARMIKAAEVAVIEWPVSQGKRRLRAPGQAVADTAAVAEGVLEACRFAGVKRIYCVPSGHLRFQVCRWQPRCGVLANRYIREWLATQGHELALFNTTDRRDALIACLWGIRAVAGDIVGAERWLDRTSN